MRALRFPFRLLVPPPEAERLPAAATLALFVIGAALATYWTIPGAGFFGLAGIVTVLTAVAATCVVAHRFWWLRLAGAVPLIGIQLFWIFCFTSLVTVLTWSVSAWVWVLAIVLLLAVVIGAAAPRMPLRVPLALPLGIAIAALASGWMREDGLLRCDDYLRVRALGAEVIIPTTPELEACRPGETFVVKRYPRQLWEHPDGRRFVITTQRGDHDYTPTGWRGKVVAEWLDGAVCQMDAGSGTKPHCFGEGKAHGIAESPLRDRVYVVAHGPRDGVIYALARSGPFGPVATAPLVHKVGLLYLDDGRDILGVFNDDGLQVYLLRASDFAPITTISAPFLPDAAHYDQASHQGIACAAIGPARQIDGNTFVAVAFTGDPFTFRPLAPSSEYPSSWLAVTWGCDWDPSTRRAYVAIASFGLLVEIDYDSGRILRRIFIGPGARTVAYDAPRRRIYVGFFLSGDIIGVDADTGAVVERWFAGRFVRQAELSRDRSALLVTSSLGVVRMPLAQPPRAAPAP